MSPTPKGARQALSSAVSVPAEFVELTSVATENTPVLVRGEGATPAEVRDLLAYAEAYSPVADELEAFAQFLRYNIASAKNRAGSEALTTYALARRLGRRPEHAVLAPHVADMRRALGNRGPSEGGGGGAESEGVVSVFLRGRAERRARASVDFNRGRPGSTRE